MKKRIIFDIDYTLLIPNYGKESNFFREAAPNIGNYFLENRYWILKEYEKKYNKYEIENLLYHLNLYSNEKLTVDFIYKWFDFNINLEEQDVSEAKELLKWIKDSGVELVVLSNWFRHVQIEKLKKLGLDIYFDEFYAGDQFLKPYKEAYLLAIGNHKPEDCIMIGDNLDQDVIEPSKLGIKVIHYTRGKDETHDYPKVKRLKEIKKLIKEDIYGIK